MPRFRRKPTEIEAEQFWWGKKWPKGVCQDNDCLAFMNHSLKAHVHTAHGNQIVYLEDGDWVTAEADGVHFYPIKPSDMTRLYEST